MKLMKLKKLSKRRHVDDTEGIYDHDMKKDSIHFYLI